MEKIELKKHVKDIFEIPEHKQSNVFPIFTTGQLSSALYILKKDSFLIITPDDFPSEISYFIVHGEVALISYEKTTLLKENEAIKTTNLKSPLKLTAKEDKTTIYVTSCGKEDYGFDTLEASNKLIEVLEKKDKYTSGHSKRVCSYAIEIAMKLKDAEVNMNSLVRAAMLHDVGKVEIPDTILNKPGKYNDEEFEVMKKHPLYSYQLVKDKIPEDVALIILQHHERLNGSGYPHHLKSEQINATSKVLMVADVFDALTSSRVYRKKFTQLDALNILDKETQDGLFDKKVVDALKKCLKAGSIRIED